MFTSNRVQNNCCMQRRTFSYLSYTWYFETISGTVTQVLAEFSPMLCPTSPKMVFGLEMLKHFLPFLDVQAESEINEFMKHLLSYCDAWNNGPTWEWVRNKVYNCLYFFRNFFYLKLRFISKRNE